MRVRIKPSFLALPLIFYIGGQMKVFLLFLSAVLIHEFSHLLMLLFKRQRVEEIAFCAAGIKILVSEGRMRSYRDDLLIAIAGPAGNLITALALFLTADIGRQNPDLYYLIGVHFLLFVFNMLPVPPLDGGIIFSAVLKQCFSYETAENLGFMIAAGTIALLWAAGFYILLQTNYNLSLLTVAAFISCAFLAPPKNEAANISR